MHSQVSIRLPEDLDRELAASAKRLRLKRSDIVRMALERFFIDPAVKEERVPYGKTKKRVGSVEIDISEPDLRRREHLMKRIQLDMDDDILRVLEHISRERAVSISVLVRQAIRRAYSTENTPEAEGILQKAAGIWKDRKDIKSAEQYVRSLRKDARLERLGLK